MHHLRRRKYRVGRQEMQCQSLLSQQQERKKIMSEAKKIQIDAVIARLVSITNDAKNHGGVIVLRRRNEEKTAEQIFELLQDSLDTMLALDLKVKLLLYEIWQNR
jgi:hypothetical protein